MGTNRPNCYPLGRWYFQAPTVLWKAVFGVFTGGNYQGFDPCSYLIVIVYLSGEVLDHSGQYFSCATFVFCGLFGCSSLEGIAILRYSMNLERRVNEADKLSESDWFQLGQCVTWIGWSWGPLWLCFERPTDSNTKELQNPKPSYRTFLKGP